jgi:branched-chain amino acid transport system substrate-binding protein
MHKVRGSLVLAAAACAVAVAACGSDSGGAGAAGSGGSGGSGGLPTTVKVGSPLDTSGSSAIATVGVDEQRGEELAVEEINSTKFLGNTKIDLKVVDTQASKETAVQTVVDMTRANKVDAFVGFTLTPNYLAAAPMIQKAGIPSVAVGLSGTGITEVGDYMFRTYPALASLLQRDDPEIARALGAKTAAYFSDSDASNVVQNHDVRKKVLEGIGIKTVADETTTSDAIDYQAQLTKIKNAHPDVLIVNLDGGQTPTFGSQAEQAGLTVPVIGDVAFGVPSVAKEAGAQCAIFTTTWDPSSTEGKNQQFVQAYQQKFGKPASQYSAWGYDGMWILAYGLKAANSANPQKLRAGLAGLKDVSGALGTYSIGPDRQPTQKGLIFQIKDKQLVPWKSGSTCTK